MITIFTNFATIRKYLRELKSYLLDSYATKSYSQEGEDMILRRIFEGQKQGFYVDIGAHHPMRYSNTYFFYKQGWSGINIDATPGSMLPFKKMRPRDINIETAISNNQQEMTFFVFNEPALNTFDRELAHQRNQGIYRIVREDKIVTQSLTELLAEYLPQGQEIDFLSIDVEGLDLEVLQSNDWQRFRPFYVLVECIGLSLETLIKDQTYQFLIQQRYELVAKSLNTAIFKSYLNHS
jgi:FkbM family methyltransferase